MHKEILTKEQVALLPVVESFRKDFGLVGGTAIAFHIGHRESIDFDLFSMKEFDNSKIRRKILGIVPSIDVTYEEAGQFTMNIGGVKFTFYQYPYPIDFSKDFEGIIKLPDLLTLAAMKAFALANRAKWKDYVDLYFILRDHFTVADITTKANELFKKEFNERIFKMQLGWFDDINYIEPIIYRPGYEVPDQIVKDALVEFSLAK